MRVTTTACCAEDDETSFTMLLGGHRESSQNWQARDSTHALKQPTPLKAPSANLPAARMPSSSFEPSYAGGLKAFKVEEERGRVRVVSQFAQGKPVPHADMPPPSVFSPPPAPLRKPFGTSILLC